MAKTIETTVYNFSELQTEKAKQKALEWAAEVSIDHEWWDTMYLDKLKT
jgi:hypothetical protein